jgi:hypothetical protein
LSEPDPHCRQSSSGGANGGSVPGQPIAVPSPTTKPGKLRLFYTAANTACPSKPMAVSGGESRPLRLARLRAIPF